MRTRRTIAPHRSSRPLRIQEVRKVNELLMIQLLHEHGVLSQSEIAARTGLQASTVFRIFQSLAERNIVGEVTDQEPEAARKGRRPLYYALNPSCAYSVGVDLSSGSAAVLLLDFRGRSVGRRVVTCAQNSEAENVIDCVEKTIEELLEEAGIDTSELLGVGIGAPGVIDIESGAVTTYARFPGMVGKPFRSRLSESLGVPVYVHNNASVIAASEYRYGRARGYESVVAFLLRSGVGGAYINHGNIFVSQQTTAFEVGHMFLNLDPTGKRRGDLEPETLEDVLSEPAILERVKLANPTVDSWDRLLEAIELDDETVCTVIDELADVLVRVVQNIALLLNPEAFLVITRFAPLSRLLAESVSRRIPPRDESTRFRIGAVLPLEYDSMIACRGAAEIVLDAYFRSPHQ